MDKSPLPLSEADELARFRDFFNNAAVGLHFVGADGTILHANRADYEPLGYTASEYIGHNIAEFHADFDVIDDMLERLTRGETLADYEARLRCKDGSIRHVLIDSSVNFVDGKFVNTRCLTRDVTAQHQALQALKDSEHRFGVFMASLPGAAWMKDLEGRYIYANDEAVRIFGTPRDRLYGHTDADIFPAETASQFHENDRSALAEGMAVQVLESMMQEDGLHYSLVSKFPITGSSGGVQLIGGVAFDVTERYHAADALQAKSHQLELVMGSVPALISYVNAEGRYEFVSKAYEEWFSLSAEQIHGRSVRDLVGREVYRTVKPYMDKALKGEATEFEQALTSRHGTRWVNARYVPDKDAEGRTRGFFALMLDISDRKQMEQQQQRLLEEATRAAEALSAANRAKDEFLGMVSHELRTPLTTILGNSQILTRRLDLLQPNERRSISDDIYKESVRLTNIIDNLLLMARFDAGQKLEMEPIILRGLVSRVIRDIARVSLHHFEMQFPAEVASVLGNETCIEQVIRNLASNAEKYSRAGTTIDLAIVDAGDCLVLQVADRGLGIEPSEADQIFEPFFRSAASSSSRSGVGIGLSVCKRLVAAMGGKIWAGPREGGGSIFSFSLPKSKAVPIAPTRINRA